MGRTWRVAALVAAVVCALGVAVASAQTPERLSDKDVRKLIEDLGKSRDTFETQLDEAAKTSVITTGRGDVRVRDVLGDLKNAVSALKGRFTEQYAANSEALVLLRQGTDIQKFLSSRPAGPGATAWEPVAASMKQLAQAYLVTFPVASNAVGRRINDGSISLAAETLANEAARLSDTLAHEPGYSKEDRDTLRKQLDAVSKESKQIRRNADMSKPASAEAQRMLDAALAVTKYFQAHEPSPTVTAQWTVVRDPIERILGGYGIPVPSFVKK